MEKYTKKLTDPKNYVESAQERISRQSAEVRKAILSDSRIWGNGESLQDFEKDCFNNATGAVEFKAGEYSTHFFDEESRRDGNLEKFKSRGSNYFISINPLRNIVSEKISIIIGDLIDINSALAIKNISWKEKTALLDYLKQHTLTIYHALQYPKRFGINLNTNHLENIQIAEKLAIDFTTIFYKHLLGLNSTVPVVSELIKITNKAESFISEINYFKMVELDNPLIILGNAYANAIKYNDVDTIIALPAGGTQPGIVTKMSMEILGKSTNLHFIPLSTHSTKKQVGEELSDTQLIQLLGEVNISGKNILVTEDNSNSGNTITKINQAIQTQNPKRVNISLAELDPWRVMIKSKFAKLEVTNAEHSDFDTAVNIVPITRKFLPDRQIRKIAAQKVVFDGLRVENINKKPLSKNEYCQILENVEYKLFEKKYKEVLKKIGDKYGYRNPFMVAQELLKELNFQKYLEIRNTNQEKVFLSCIATASVTYSYIPQELSSILQSQNSITNYQQGVCAPWIINGTKELFEKVFKSIISNGNTVYFWTKGDFYRQGYEPLPGANEQGFRYQISGLKSLINELKDKYKISDSSFRFLSLPNKLRLIKEVIIMEAKKIDAEVFVVEDTIENIVEAKKIITNENLIFNSFLINREDKSASLRDCGNQIEKMSDKKIVFVFDMDDTLLHEDFRKEHQPINMFLELKNLDVI